MSLSQSIGIAADKLGRQNCLIGSLLCTLAFDVGCAFAERYWLWIILRGTGAFFLGQ